MKACDAHPRELMLLLYMMRCVTLSGQVKRTSASWVDGMV